MSHPNEANVASCGTSVESVADWDDIRRCALALPEMTEDTNALQWRVGGKLFLWERPLRKADLAALGSDAPSGPILGIRTADLEAKEAMLAEEPEVFFTTPHFNGYPAVLAQLGRMTLEMLEVVVVDAYVARASKRLGRLVRGGGA